MRLSYLSAARMLLLLFLFFSCESGPQPDYENNATAARDSTRYRRQVLATGLDEPMQMAILPNQDVLIVERKGRVCLYKHASREIRPVFNFRVFSGIEDGLLGVCADPGFSDNGLLYIYYAVPGDSAVNRLSQFKFLDDSVDFSSEKVVLEVPMQRKYCCHSAGYVRFDKKGSLYLSTGDNTNAEETEGFTPVDERPGREWSDDQATAANSNDLRGKILRIKPRPDGTYSIPDGNLFPKDGSLGRPEIFVMGCRNPFRFSIDPKKGYLYWGDVGPDTKFEGPDGLLSFDEINQAKKAGFFGWPYFLANNQPLPLYDYLRKKVGFSKDPDKPMNLSPYNTGIKQLPPAQPAMIWYNKSESARFPLVGKGGASAMAGPVFYSDQFTHAKHRLPAYYNGKLIIYDWARRWFRAVSFDESGNYAGMEPFLPWFQFAAPIDVQFSPDGALYVLEYGSYGFTKNADAKLSRIEYHDGVPPPIPDLAVDREFGGAPLKVHLSADKSQSFASDNKLDYVWKISGEVFNQPAINYTFQNPGQYDVSLVVRDVHGTTSELKRKIYVGNNAPVVTIETDCNRSFYFPNQVLNYRVRVNDPDEKTIDSSKVAVDFGYLPTANDAALVLSGRHVQSTDTKGGTLLASNDCSACHSRDHESVGPGFISIAKRYARDKEAVEKLARKIIRGGSGSWGTRPMTPHPDLTIADAREITKYILSLHAESRRGLSGTLKLRKVNNAAENEVYLLRAAYSDKGFNGMPSLTAQDHLLLKRPVLEAEEFDAGNVGINTITTMFFSYIYGINDNKFIAFRNKDLSHLNSLRVKVQCSGAGGTIEMRADSLQGPLLATLTVPAGSDKDPKKNWKQLSGTIAQTSGIHDVYFVFRNKEVKDQELFRVDAIEFSR